MGNYIGKIYFCNLCIVDVNQFGRAQEAFA